RRGLPGPALRRQHAGQVNPASAGAGSECSRAEAITDQEEEPMAEQLRTGRDLFGVEHPEVRLPEELTSAVTADDAGADLESLAKIAKANPKDSGAWAALAFRLIEADEPVTAYACARTGYHRGLDALRGNGWRGTGPVPWEHVPNQGVPRAIGAPVVAATRRPAGRESSPPSTCCKGAPASSRPFVRGATGGRGRREGMSRHRPKDIPRGEDLGEILDKEEAKSRPARARRRALTRRRPGI